MANSAMPAQLRHMGCSVDFQPLNNTSNFHLQVMRYHSSQMHDTVYNHCLPGPAARLLMIRPLAIFDVQVNHMMNS